MRKILMLLLVIGILVGTCAVVEDVCQEDSFGEQVDFTGDESPDGPGGPAPCGGGETGGGGGTPG